MATNDNKPVEASVPPALTDAERLELEALRAQVRQSEEAETQAKSARPSDQTIPGGAYLVNDVLVNAAGEPIDAKGNVKKGD